MSFWSKKWEMFKKGAIYQQVKFRFLTNNYELYNGRDLIILFYQNFLPIAHPF